MDTITVGIIGAGRIGQLHGENLLQLKNVHLKAISDLNIDHLKGTIFEKEVPVITSKPDEILQDPEIDAVFVCSSTDSHVDLIKKAAYAGKHIFCEKPISFNIDDSKEALQVTKEMGVKFQVGFNRRYDKHFRKAYESVKMGKVGEIHIIKITSRDPSIPPENYIKHSGGMFMDMTIHDFDMIRYLSGMEIKDITVKAANLIDDSFGKYDDVDTAITTVTFENGALGVIDNSRQAVYGYDQRIEVFGDQGVILVDNEKQSNIQISNKDHVVSDKPKYFFLERYKDSYIEEVNDFVSAILTNSEIKSKGEDGLKAELLALAAKKSYVEKRTVNLSELSEELMNSVK